MTDSLSKPSLPQPEKVRTIVASPQVAAARISPDGRWLLAGGFDGTVRRWDLQAQPAEPAEETAGKPAPKSGKPAPDSGELAPPQILPGHNGWVEAIAMHETWLLTGDSWGRLAAWRQEEELRPLWEHPEAHDGWLRQVVVSPDGRHVATCGRDRAVRLWSLTDGQKVQQWDAQEDVYCLAYHPDGRLFSGDCKGRICQWQPDVALPVRSFDAVKLYKYDRLQDVGGVKVLAVDAATGALAAAGAIPDHGGTVQGEPTLLLFDLESGQLRRTIKLGAVKDGYVHDLARHPAGFWIAVTCGTPGTGQLLLVRDDEDEPAYVDSKLANCHSVSYHAGSEMLAVTTTNKGSNGNGRRLNKEGVYEWNTTPVELMRLAAR